MPQRPMYPLQRQRPLYLLIVTRDGYAKRTPLDEIKPRRKSAKGTTTLREELRIGGAAIVSDDGDVLIVTERGRVLRTEVSQIAVLSRSARGGRVIQLEEGDRVVAVLPV